MMGPPDEDDEVAIDNCNESSKDPSSALFFRLRQSSMWPPRRHWWTPVRPVFPPCVDTPSLPSELSPLTLSLFLNLSQLYTKRAMVAAQQSTKLEAKYRQICPILRLDLMNEAAVDYLSGHYQIEHDVMNEISLLIN